MSENPHILPDYSPLKALVVQALRHYGEFHPTTLDSDMALLMIDLANDVVHEYLVHPYFTELKAKDAATPTPALYASIDDARPIPDEIMRAGILAFYSAQQGSQKASFYGPRYYRILNRKMWDMLSGSGKIEMFNVRTQTGRDPITGQKVDPLDSET